MPDEAGFGMATWPLYSGLIRSAQAAGVGRFLLAASTVLKHRAEAQTSMPTHCGGSAGSRIVGVILSSPAGA